MIREKLANFDDNSISDREQKMDGNNLHTSVVIEMPNEKQPDRVNKFKIDFEDVEASKEYVIDELFCGDEVAVYALFEASDIANKKSQRHFMTASSSDFKEEEFRFTHRGFLKKRQGKDCAELCLERKNDNVNHQQNTSQEEKGKLESTSTGVNTDIGQSPRLLEEVQKAISFNFSKMDDRNTDLSSVFSVKSSRDIMEMMAKVSSVTFNSEGESPGKNSTGNVVIVPVIIKEEKLNHWKNERDQRLTDEKLTDMAASTNLSSTRYGNSEDLEILENKSAKNETLKKEEKNPKSEEHLLEELKNLQEKFNALVNSLESIGFSLHKKKEITPEEKLKPAHNTFNKYDDIPIFSTGNFHFFRQREKPTNKDVEEEMQPTESYSSSFIKDLIDNIDMTDDKINDLILDEIYSPQKQIGKLDLPELINWKEVENHRSARLSKSQTSIRCVRSKIVPSLKKSHSIDLGGEGTGLKKIGNVFCKLEGGVKKQKSKAIRQNEYELVGKLNEIKLNDLQKTKTSEGLIKIERNKLSKSSEKSILENANRMKNIDSGDAKDSKITKRAGIKGRITEKLKMENKIPYQELKQKLKSVGRRGTVKETGQSKLHVDMLIKNFQNCDQKYSTIAKCNSPRLPRVNYQKKDQKPTKEQKSETSELSVRKNLEKEEITRNETGALNVCSTPSSEVIVELFSKKPTFIENFHSEIDLECLYNNDSEPRKNSGNGRNERSSDCQNAVVKSVWALTKVLLYEDGTKKMEVLEASLNPPDYHFNQNLTEDKVR